MLKIIFSVFGLMWVSISFYLEYSFHNPFTQGLFSSSGAVLLVGAILLNFKHMSFNVKKRYYQDYPVAQCASIPSEEEQKKAIKPKILDNVCEIAFMLIGTAIWAYGNIFLLSIKYFF